MALLIATQCTVLLSAVALHCAAVSSGTALCYCHQWHCTVQRSAVALHCATVSSGIMPCATVSSGIMHCVTVSSGIMHCATVSSGIVHCATVSSGIMHCCLLLTLYMTYTHYSRIHGMYNILRKIKIITATIVTRTASVVTSD